MEISREEAHEINNQLAIAIGMVEIAIKYLSKSPLDTNKLGDRLDKGLTALRKINDFMEEKKRAGFVKP